MMLRVFFLVWSFVNTVVGQHSEGDLCTYEKTNKLGICKNIVQCPEAINIVQQGLHPQRCGFHGLQVIVCCAEPEKELSAVPSRSPGQISKEKCIEYSQYVWKIELNPTLLAGGADIRRHECPFNRQQLIVGGKPASRREFPHMVHIGYDVGDNVTEWACGGSLISDRFVLTAAHCVNDIELQEAKFARMGITTISDDDHLQVFDIIERINYPEYQKRFHYHDIALLKLNGSVELNTWVRPACLYTHNSSPNSNVLASGWGAEFSGGDKSKKLLKVLLKLYSQEYCSTIYKNDKKLNDGIRDDIMICAGSPLENEDTCQGDSGGPLQVYKEKNKNMTCMYDIVGITSYGVVCAIAPDVPAVYTRVSYYIKWIEDIVWPLTEDAKKYPKK